MHPTVQSGAEGEGEESLTFHSFQGSILPCFQILLFLSFIIIIRFPRYNNINFYILNAGFYLLAMIIIFQISN